MRFGRRIAATVALLALLQPRTLFAAAQCDVRADAKHHDAHAMTHAHHDGAPESGTAKEPCSNVPPQTDCCQPLASCGVEVGLGAIACADCLTPARGAQLDALTMRPLSFLAAPEPPPPRA